MEEWDWPTIAAVGVLVASLIVVISAAMRARPGAQEVERRRRLYVYERGRLADATITEVAGDTVHYSYSVAGVSYHTAQDLSSLARLLPEDRGMMVGPSYCKYQLSNPANSIVFCESWSGRQEFEKRNERNRKKNEEPVS